MLCNTASLKTHDAIILIVLIRTRRLVKWKYKPNTSRKSESVPFCLHGSQRVRGLGFHLYLDFWCPLTAATMGMIYWETGHMKIVKK